jgi:predicted signal transduction protein with EAL and GGDEF domain
VDRTTPAGERAAPLSMEATWRVRLTARDLEDLRLVDRVVGVLDAAALAPQQLQVRITGALPLELAGRLLHAVESLRALGVQVTVPDHPAGSPS